MPTKKNPSPPKKSAHSKAKQGKGCAVIAWALSIGFIVVIGAIGLFLFNFLREGPAITQSSPIDDNTSPELVSAQREEVEARLNSYGWVDEQAGVVRIPVEEAMAIVAESGLPVGSVPTETPTPEPTATATPQIEPPTAEETPVAEESEPAPAPDETIEPTIKPSPTIDLANVSFNDHVLPIFEQYCTECHGGDDPEEGLRLTGYDEVMAGSWNGSVIEPGNVEESYLIEQIVTGRMPKRGPKVPPAEIEIITAWVGAGAPDN